MLRLEDIKKGFENTDNRPVTVWEGHGDSRVGSGGVFRVVLTKKNSLSIELKSGKNAMDQDTWSKTTNHEVDAELLAKILMEAMKQLVGASEKHAS